MSSVLAKFYLANCVTSRNFDPGGDVVAQVTFHAVKSEPFGKYTPSGEITMSIRNAAAAKVFIDAWDTFVHGTDPNDRPPEFYVRLTPAHEVDSGKVEA